MRGAGWRSVRKWIQGRCKENPLYIGGATPVKFSVVGRNSDTGCEEMRYVYRNFARRDGDAYRQRRLRAKSELRAASIVLAFAMYEGCRRRGARGGCEGIMLLMTYCLSAQLWSARALVATWRSELQDVDIRGGVARCCE